ncbi:MAG: hypothetical protein KME32_03160 [Mojavia pulchra JT2-VF2]|jgi:hypothetical protein|uniref:Uncharacterized protein n=1 Tax=Mojavia pulchra JT2-VF2 TaxID=287848 RepID=A0A951UFS7_9NOST|nr:hypothetical protein [Mojavia pulchra JT2-VF2]
MNSLAIQLTLHGAIVLLIGLLSGIPYGYAITKKQDENIARGWRVAHSGLSMGGTTMIAFSAVLSNLELNPVFSSVLVWSSVVSGYGFAIALPYGAWVGHRGLSIEGPSQNKVVYIGNMLGAIGSLIGTLVLIIGCLKTIL